MAAISQVIPNLLGGVSQQPDPVKLPGQLRQAENVLLDPTFGCRKRPPTAFVAKLDDNIPDTAKWFNIFRDNNERYLVAIYRNNNSTVIRVWEADTGVERTVNIQASAGAYLDVNDTRNLNELNINDYTLLSNSEKVVSMSADTDGDSDAEALVVINQVAYNTTYNIDFLKDGQQTTQQKVYRATKLSVDPGAFEDLSSGNCVYAATQNFVETQGSKTGLGFRLQTRCQPTQVTTEVPGDPYPTGVVRGDNSLHSANYQLQAYCTILFGQSDTFAFGSYLYHQFSGTTAAGDLTVRLEFRITNNPFNPDYKDEHFFSLTNVDIVSYTINYSSSTKWSEGLFITDTQTFLSDTKRFSEDPDNGINGVYLAGDSGGVAVTVDRVTQAPPTSQYSFKSRYTTQATLINGGIGWRIGDSVQVQMGNKSYTVTVEDESFGYSYVSESSVSFTTPANATSGGLDVGAIVGSLTTSINGLSAYTATPIGNVIHCVRTDGRDFNLQTRGGTTNNALYAIKSSVNDVSTLPSQCVPGVVLLVRNSAESDSDDYYVKFVSAAGDIPGQGAWEETHSPGITTEINPSTMPHAMIREADGTFTVRPLSAQYDDVLFWASREVGDENSNPNPTFVGKGIKDMFFYMNRLGFLSEDAVILSQPGDYFNFFVGSAIAVSDADPIDMTASSTRPAKLRAALGTPKGLLLFADNSQFLLSTSEAAFGPATVKMSEMSNYSYSSDVKPLETGVSVLFATEADTFSKVYEMAVDSIDNRPLVSENTRIVPEYIPPNLTLAAASPNNSMVFYGDGSTTLWTFKFFNTGNERSLAGWSKWIMPSPVKLVAFDHDTGYIVCDNGGECVVLKVEMLDDPKTSPISAFGLRFVPRLDHFLFKSQTTVSASTDPAKSIVRFPTGSYVVGTTPNIIGTNSDNSTLYRNPEIQQDSTGYYVEVDSAFAQFDFILGLEYDMLVELPSFFVVNEKTADRRNVPMVENVYIDMYYSGSYEVNLSRTGYLDRSLDLEAVQSDIYLANTPALDEIISRAVPVYCRGDYARITISTSAPLPASITSYRWEGHYNNRGISTIQ